MKMPRISQFLYNPRNDLWFCNRLGVDPSS
jgi:hypothetical protein